MWIADHSPLSIFQSIYRRAHIGKNPAAYKNYLFLFLTRFDIHYWCAVRTVTLGGTYELSMYRLHRYTVPPSLSCTSTSRAGPTNLTSSPSDPRVVHLPCPYLRRRHHAGHRSSPHPRFCCGPPAWSTGPEMEFLDIKFNKRFKSFAPCYSQSLLLSDFKENQYPSLVLKILTKIRETRNLESIHE